MKHFRSRNLRIAMLAPWLVGWGCNTGWSDEVADEAEQKPRRNRLVIDATGIMEFFAGAVQVQQNEAQVKQLKEHFKTQFRSLLICELEFVRQLGDLPLEQRRLIRKAGEASLETAAGEMARQQLNPRQRAATAGLSPGQMIRNALAKAIRATLTAEQLVQYADDAAKRQANRKRAAIDIVVSSLDQALFLTKEQCDKITAAIESEWQDGWERWIMFQLYNGQYFPQIPDKAIVPHLDAEQKSIWSTLQKVDFGHWNGMNAQAQDDAEWWGVEPTPAPMLDAPEAAPVEEQDSP